MVTQNPQYPHLQMIERGISQDYKSRPGGGGTPPPLPPRLRAMHGSALRQRLDEFVAITAQRKTARQVNNLQEGAEGITIEFKSAVGFDLAFQSLDLQASGIELLNVRLMDDVTYATCYVPDGKLRILSNKVSSYLDTVDDAKPKNVTLIDSIESIGLATFSALWTDEVAPPADLESRLWEVWLRMDTLDALATFHRFNTAANKLDIQVSSQWIVFPGRVVVCVKATREQLTTAIELLNLIAEIRYADHSYALSHNATICEQDAFVAGMVDQIALGGDEVAISILDTGVSRTHPLIAPLLAEGDMHSLHPAWPKHDHHGHGTNMAGLALYGNLQHVIANAPISVSYRLESVTILPPAGQAQLTSPFGALTQQAVAYCEIAAPHRKRIICKTITTQPCAAGEPSSYSGAIDASAFADGNSNSRLFVISAGNTPDTYWPNSPNSNLGYWIERPGQSWNALTVGAYTDLHALPGTADYAGWQTVAERGELSPFSATSVSWEKWPIKPEVLFEGGNVANDPAGIDFETPNTLQLLTTRTNHGVRPLGYTSMTSAAAAQAARLAATVQSEYLDYWPETIRGLIVHNAEWTAAQRRQFVTDQSQTSKLRLLRTCGYGVPQEERTVFSARNRVTIVAQETIQPYKKEGSEGKMNECRFFALPWPKEMLYALAEQNVRLKITLSYFVEPSPGKRGWLNRYRYASHGLRFDLRRNNEAIDTFNKRVNAAQLAKDEKIDAPDDGGWFLGSQLRTFGSVHSDIWSGMAINLASRDLIAVYPVIGWWREQPKHEHCENDARFSLILSLESADTDLDLYSAIQTELNIPISNEITNALEPGD